jgi:hypothetical protein
VPEVCVTDADAKRVLPRVQGSPNMQSRTCRGAAEEIDDNLIAR